MVFSSLIFLYSFLPVTFSIYYLVSFKYKNLVILISSLIFYAWGELQHIGLMLFFIIFNWLLGILIVKIREKNKILILGFGVSVNLIVLCYYKYSGFIIQNFALLFYEISNSYKFEIPALPIGISFITFHCISYLVDIYRKKAFPLLNPVNMGVYITMFPQLVAGPIIRFSDVSSQIIQRSFNINQITSGIERFTFGLSKKILIANVLGEFADEVFSIENSNLTFEVAWIGIICYTLQIYFDFSGYSDMAIGLGKMLGFEFFENFNYPYISHSIKEFWHRWHISLSTWFRDYVYIPLGGNKKSSFRANFNLFIVFVLSGLWHGSNWNFILWGMLHGTLLIVEKNGLERLMNKLPKIFSNLYVLIFITFSWILFRTNNLTQTKKFIFSLFNFTNKHITNHYLEQEIDFQLIITICLGVTLSTPLFSFLSQDYQSRKYANKVNTPSIKSNLLHNRISHMLILYVKPLLIFTLLILCMSSLASNLYNPFIYFKF